MRKKAGLSRNYDLPLVEKIKLLIIFIVFGAFLYPHLFPSTYKQPEQHHQIKITYEQFVKNATLSANLSVLLTPTPRPTTAPKPIAHLPKTEVKSNVVYAAEKNPNDFCLRVPVLLYHHIQPENQAIQKKQTSLSVDSSIFDAQMAYLASSGYTALSVKQLVDALRSHTSVPAKSVLITLDDGYKDAHEYAYPVFQKYHLISNLMIATGLVGNSDYLSWQQIEEMTKSGLIFYTDHTWSHYSVSGSDFDKIKFEIETGKRELEEHVSQKVDTFAYPYGTFGSSAISILQKDGFLGAFSTMGGFEQCESFIMTLHRTRIGNAPLGVYGL